MLYETMFGSPKGSNKSIGVGAWTGSISLGSQTDVPGVEDQLKRVESELRETGRIGTLGEPGEYVEATMRMRWGMFDDLGERPEGDPPLVFFGGFDKTGPIIVGLAGSTANIVGYRGASSTHSRSNTSVITKWLVSGVNNDSPPDLPDWWDMEGEHLRLFEGVGIALHYLRQPTLNLHFIAKTLAVGTLRSVEHFTGVKEARVIVGTPLWVTEEAPYFKEDSRWGLENRWDSVDGTDEPPADEGER